MQGAILAGLAAIDVTPLSMGMKTAGVVVTKLIELFMDYSAFHRPRGETPAIQGIKQKNMHDLVPVGDPT